MMLAELFAFLHTGKIKLHPGGRVGVIYGMGYSTVVRYFTRLDRCPVC